MLIVMTNGDTDGTWGGGSSPEAIELLCKELLGDVIPMIEKNYRVTANRANRAITGLSMGGGQAFTIGLKHLETFAWVGEFSSGLLSDTEFNLAKHLPGFLDDPGAREPAAQAALPELRHRRPAHSRPPRSDRCAEGQADPLHLVPYSGRSRMEGLAAQPGGVPAEVVPVGHLWIVNTLHRIFLCTIRRGLCHTGRNVGAKLTDGSSREDFA